ncbi:MAG: hypothetical protein NTX15_02335, partial [Candidatus Kapabacteria bacterium]|nr:hypothetical protein [Candidatus Kapabacteria bacterium]
FRPMRYPLFLALSATAILIVGCQPDFLTYNNLHKLQKGMTRAQVLEELPKSPTNTRSLSADGHSYTIDDFPLQTAQAKSKTQNYNGYTGVTTTTRTTTDYTNIFLCLFENGRLRYWGMIGDFSKTEDVQMQSVAPSIYNTYIRDAP